MSFKSLALLPLFFVHGSLAPVHAQGGVQNFCILGANGARISASGSASFSANGGSGDLVLHAAPIAPGTPGLFFFGDAVHQPLPFGQGYSCLGGTLHRLAVVFPAAGQSASSFALDYLDPASAAAQIAPGSTWYFQFWFRSGGGFDLSDALKVQFLPPFPLVGASTVAEGAHSAHPLATQPTGGIVLVENATDWAGLWAQHATSLPASPPPFVDFTVDAVVAVFAGWRSSSGYEISVQSLNLSVAALDVGTLETTPGAGCGVLTVLTQPFQFVRVPRVPALFLRDWRRGSMAQQCP
ncbi:MAG: protease complex subunit PrcB family protein [Planctomycetes bacterium]|nr:protease complex subunit PrcB family protein [Planctomycetota bacterium]